MQEARAMAEDPRLAGYRPAQGVADELFLPDGTVRPVWTPFVERLLGTPPDDIRERFERGDQYLRDAGVYFRQYSNDTLQEREWPLSHVPVILSDAEWTTICDGLAQRADLLEAVMADLYGTGRLVTEGHLPAELVAGNPHWHRPMVGIRPSGGHFLHFLAFELGRSPVHGWSSAIGRRRLRGPGLRSKTGWQPPGSSRKALPGSMSAASRASSTSFGRGCRRCRGRRESRGRWAS